MGEERRVGEGKEERDRNRETHTDIQRRGRDVQIRETDILRVPKGTTLFFSPPRPPPRRMEGVA